MPNPAFSPYQDYLRIVADLPTYQAILRRLHLLPGPGVVPGAAGGNRPPDSNHVESRQGGVGLSNRAYPDYDRHCGTGRLGQFSHAGFGADIRSSRRSERRAWGVPLTGNDWPGRVEIEGQPPVTKPSDRIAIPLRSVTPGYFNLLGQSVSEGRDFRFTDNRGARPVAVVNRALAERYFPMPIRSERRSGAAADSNRQLRSPAWFPIAVPTT